MNQNPAAITALSLPMPLGVALLHVVHSYCLSVYSYYSYYYYRIYRALFGNHSDNKS